ncbi:hypothetical protein [Mariprofundus ferrooxydans]|jgi:hypothetical protein|uniref:Carbohydrate-binding protein n=1 Tax=Mariprofundus ferrooxydans PV-1 TaxID=314345 RepID=Q0F0U9_9PROT|nr:hypothetical protein [Mariprofundus ferrooxydans]EAU55442.1 hypothetical protein SPV1_11936 [Mariprofundus ferrooxydans PV-1]KON47648.1 hypothetical protein AL013_06655 [Mariprofundus ferrooxydans]
MRKKLIARDMKAESDNEESWLDLENLVQVEMSSEDEAYPIESALAAGTGPGWRAAEAGEQTLRLLFDQPQRIELIRLLFQVDDQERTQQFTLRWSPDGGATYHEIARQQYNFSAPDATQELETFRVDFDGVTALELQIIPDISGGNARASLARWAVA